VQNRKDLLQAHRLMAQRAGLALLQGEADTAEQPLRRINVATFAGFMIAALAVAVFWLIGVLTHSGAQLQRDARGAVIMDKDTGMSYVWCGGKLCPTVNYASALLALQTANPKLSKVSQESLARFPQGEMIGIPGLPAPPVPANLIHGPWSVCVRTLTTSTASQQAVTLVAGRSVGGQPISDNHSVLVRSQHQTWVIWHDQRRAITGRYLNVATGFGGQPSTAVAPAWLDSLDEGPPIAPPQIPDIGQPTARGPTGPATVGQVYEVPGVSGTQWYVQLSDGVAQISKTQAALLQFAPGQQVPRPMRESPQDVEQHPSPQQVHRGDLPPVPPTAVPYTAATPLCAVYNGAARGGQVTLSGTIPADSLAIQAAGTGSTGSTGGAGSIVGASADFVWLPPGAGALVGVVTYKGQQTASTYFLVIRATRYALASPMVASYLGYALNTERTLVPANIVSLIPQGPELDPGRARLTVANGH